MSAMKVHHAFQQGDIVRHSKGPTALSQLEVRHAGGWHAKHCLGGYLFVDDHHIKHATDEDIKEAQSSKYYCLNHGDTQ
jgi:hypothetical protein